MKPYRCPRSLFTSPVPWFLVSAALAVLGVVIGEGMRRRLAALSYRRGDVELSRPSPGDRRWVVPATGASLFALGWVFLPDRWPLLLISDPVAIGAVWVSAIDLDVHRLPDAVVLPLLAWTLIGLGATATLLAGVSFLSALAGGALLGGFLWVLNLASAGALGFGDVKIGLLLGLLTGSTSLRSVWLLGMLAFLAAVVAAHFPRRRAEVPLGPFLFGAWLAVTVAGALP
jgi:leader peptidase (prepilin peptidase)/N-methyltransferase